VGLPGVAERLQPLVRWLGLHWAGRVVFATVAEFRRLEIFDRSMALGAQLFTSVVPILIMLSVWVGDSASQQFANAVTMPSAAAEVLDQALVEPGGTVILPWLLLARKVPARRLVTRRDTFALVLLAGG